MAILSDIRNLSEVWFRYVFVPFPKKRLLFTTMMHPWWEVPITVMDLRVLVRKINHKTPLNRGISFLLHLLCVAGSENWISTLVDYDSSPSDRACRPLPDPADELSTIDLRIPESSGCFVTIKMMQIAFKATARVKHKLASASPRLGYI